VAREDDGTMHRQTECGRPAFFNPEEVNKRPLAEVNLTSKCPICVAKVDGVPVSGLTGRPVMP